METILLTGAGGYVGSNAAEYFVRCGYSKDKCWSYPTLLAVEPLRPCFPRELRETQTGMK